MVEGEEGSGTPTFKTNGGVNSGVNGGVGVIVDIPMSHSKFSRPEGALQLWLCVQPVDRSRAGSMQEEACPNVKRVKEMKEQRRR